MQRYASGDEKATRASQAVTSKLTLLSAISQIHEIRKMKVNFGQAFKSIKLIRAQVDALALRADERRDKLRKASGRSKYPLIRRYLNGETRLSKPQSLYGKYIAIQREPGELKHLSSRRKRKKHRFRK